eukprot:GEMP01052485.1.p1 GENE.GEMP01052485.1~~GEMP01052485.1.p1  ORF type:complete len:279 (+),score=53.66 GEMP01052485.1:49-837(+)
MVVLNPNAALDAVKPENISEVLRKSLIILKGKYMAEDGSGVNYAALEASSEWTDFMTTLSLLHHVKSTDLPDDASKIAFFVNVYNVLMIHGLLHKKHKNHPIQEKDSGFFDEVAYNVGGHVLSLNDMEHGILRANRAHPGKEIGPFPGGDARLEWCVKEVDPRIHFALNCGAKGCPRIQVYSADNLQKGLEMACNLFLKTAEAREDDRLLVSMIFKWYGSDFGATEAEIAKWICDRTQHLKGRSFSHLEFEPYDWNLNSSSN